MPLTIHAFVTSLAIHCDQLNLNRASETRGRCVKIIVVIVINRLIDLLHRVRNKIMYVLSWLFMTVYAFPQVLYWYLFAPLLRNSVDTKITLSWPHKQLATPVHTSFYIKPTMMTSSNGNIFRVTGHLCGEFTGLRWIPYTKASDADLWCFLWSASE